MPALPSSLALTSIADGSNIVAADHRNNNSAIQIAVNALITDLSSGVSGQTLEATSSSAIAWRARSVAGVYATGAQSVANNAETTVTFDAELIDTDTIHDNVTNNSRLTIKTAGIYAAVFGGSFAASATGIRYGLIRKNGTTQLGARFDVSTLGGGATGTVQGWAIADLVVTDYLELRVFQTSGGALNFDSTVQPTFSMFRIA